MTTVVDDDLGALEPIASTDAYDAEPPHPSFARRVWRGPEADPAWARPALFGLLAVTAVLYMWGLGASAWANSYYTMAVQAATKSWKAFFYGSLDAGNSITVDKSPASLWVMDISARIFGVNSWSILVPQALEGVATVAVLYVAIKRWFGAAAGLLAGAVMACTPVAALMFRFNNPDALLILLLTLGAYATMRALERGHTGWLIFAFSCVGFGFLAKMLQALLVVPAFALVYLFAGPPKLGRRIAQLAIAGVALIVSAGWWIAIVQLTPASARPYVGGSQNNSLWNLIFGYNGFGRLTGNETGSVGGQAGPNGAGRWGPTGWLRMFNSQFGAQASWLLPAALILLVAGLAFTVRMPRTDRTRAALLLWGGWLVVTALAFSLGKGIIHEYYTVALAPPIAAIVGIGATRVWNGRQHPAARAVLCVAFAVTAGWAYVLLGRVPNWHRELRALVLLGAVVGTVALAFSATREVRARRAATMAIAGGALAICLAAPAAYAVATVATPHSGALPVAGPAGVARAGGGPGGAGGAGRPGGPGGFAGRNFRGFGQGQFPPFGGANANGNGSGQFPPFFGGGNTNGNGNAFPRFGGRNGGGLGGLLDAQKPPAAVVALLKDNASQYKWVAATTGANNAAGYQLTTGDAVMAIGGFNGTDPSPTLAQFQRDVAKHQIHYYIAGGGGPGGGFGGGPQQSSTTSAISQWVQQNFTSQTVGGVTIYDLTAAN